MVAVARQDVLRLVVVDARQDVPLLVVADARRIVLLRAAVDAPNHVEQDATPTAPRHVGLDVLHNAPNLVELVVRQDAPNHVALVALLGVKGAALWLVQAIAQVIVTLLVQEDAKANVGRHAAVLAMRNALAVHGVANTLLMERAVGAKPTVLVCAVQHAKMYVITSL